MAFVIRRSRKLLSHEELEEIKPALSELRRRYRGNIVGLVRDSGVTRSLADCWVGALNNPGRKSIGEFRRVCDVLGIEIGRK